MNTHIGILTLAALLPEQVRVPLILSQYDETSHADTDGILRCSAKAVEVRIYRTHQQLRVGLGDLLPSG